MDDLPLVCKPEQLLDGHFLDLVFARMGLIMSASSEQIFIGIDVSKASLDLAVRGQAKVQRFANTEPGIAAWR